MITVRQNETIQKKTRNKRRSKIKIKHWIIRAVEYTTTVDLVHIYLVHSTHLSCTQYIFILYTVHIYLDIYSPTVSLLRL